MMRRRMKMWLLAFVMIMFGAACQEKEVVGDENGKLVTLNLKVEEATPNEVIYLYEKNNREILDSASTNNNGEFTFKVKVASPSYYGLNIYGKQNEYFILGSHDIKVTAAGTRGGKFEVKGSKDNEYLTQYKKLRKEAEAKSAMWQEKAYANPTSDELQQLIAEQQAYAAEFMEHLKALINEMDGSIAAIEAARMLDIDTDADFLENLADELAQKYPESNVTEQFKEEVYSMTRLAVGRTAPDFELKTPKDKAIKLSDLRGKYVLVDFWASWCGPCRRENPNVIKMYQRYGGKKFEILGVSTDQNEAHWRKAIRDDGLLWPQVRDTQYDASMKYNITAIPFTVLVDPKGQIVAKNLRGVLLQQKLEELLM